MVENDVLNLLFKEGMSVLANPIYVGMGPYTAVIHDDVFITCAERLIRENGHEAYFKALIENLRRSWIFEKES